MSSPTDPRDRATQKHRSPVTGRPVERAPDGLPADLNVTTARPSPSPAAAAGVVKRTDADGTHPVEACPPPAAGSIPGYELLGELGRGGMGVVYKARHITLDRLVALKVMIGGQRSDPDSLLRFLSEAKAVAAIKHPNVVEVYDYGEANERPFMALEFLPGGSLADLLEGARGAANPPAAARQTAELVGQIARGVAAAHARGIVHRDLKPANVLLDEAGVPKVADFGLAKCGGSDLTQLGQVVGTPAYMSPEQVRGESKFVGPEADVWALGVILHEALTGADLFTGSTLEVFAKVLHAEPEPPSRSAPGVPRELDLICQKCLAQRPEARYPTAKELASDLQQFLHPAPPCAARGGTAGRAVKRWQPIIVAVAVFALFAAGWLLTAVVDSLLTGARPGSQVGVAESQKEEPLATPRVEDLPARPPASGVAPVHLREIKMPAPRFRGSVEVLIERALPPAGPRLHRLDAHDNVLPLRLADGFRIQGELDPPGYVYVVMVDPGHDVTPLYPWNAAKGWGSRPTEEQRVGKVTLPPDVGEQYTSAHTKQGIATVVMFASATPLDVPDAEVAKWFKDLPELTLPARDYRRAVWFVDYEGVKEVRHLPDSSVVRGAIIMRSEDPFRQWQSQLQKAIGNRVAFEAAISFVRTDGK